MPDSLFPKAKEPVKLTLILSNPTDQTWSFSLSDIKARSKEKEPKILEAERVIENARKKFSQEKSKLSREQAKALTPYIEHKMQELRDSLVKAQDIPPGRKVTGVLFIEVPRGAETLILEVTAPKEIHKFSFQVIDM
jgi:hypothetical protein